MTQTDPGFDASRTAEAEPSRYRMGFPQDEGPMQPPPPVAGRGGFPAWLAAALVSIVVSVVVVLVLYYALIKPNINDETKKDVSAILGGQVTASASGSSSQQIVGTLPPTPAPPVNAGTGNSLGDPTTFRLTAGVAQGQSTSASSPPAGSVVTIPGGAVLSITDIVFDNPNGDAGTIELRQSGKTLLSFQLANFRDYDLHLVAPLTYTGGQTLQLFVTCTQVGSGPVGGTVPSSCQDSLTYFGYQKATGASSSSSSST